MKIRWLVLAAMVGGCGGGTLTDRYRETARPAPPGIVVPPLREGERTMTLNPDLNWAHGSAAEGLSRMKELEYPAEGGMRSGGMEPFIERHAPMALVIFGSVLLAAGIAGAIIFKPFWKVFILGGAGTGIALIVAGVAFESKPWLAPAILISAIVAGAVWAFLHFRKQTQQGATLTTIVKGVENAGADAAVVKQKIKEAAKASGTKATVDKVVAKSKGA